MARPKKYNEETKIVGFRVPLSEVNSFKESVNRIRSNVNLTDNIVNKTNLNFFRAFDEIIKLSELSIENKRIVYDHILRYLDKTEIDKLREEVFNNE